MSGVGFDWDTAQRFGGFSGGTESVDESTGSVTLPFCITQSDTQIRETVWFAGTSREQVLRMVAEYASACASVHGACQYDEGVCRY